MGIALWAVIGLAVIGAIVLFVLGRKSWRFVHNAFTFLCLAAAIVLLVYAAPAVKTHIEWRQKLKEFSEAEAKEKTENRNLMYGPENNLDPNFVSVVSMENIHGRTTNDVGLVWRGCELKAVDASGITVELPPTLVFEWNTTIVMIRAGKIVGVRETVAAAAPGGAGGADGGAGGGPPADAVEEAGPYNIQDAGDDVVVTQKQSNIVQNDVLYGFLDSYPVPRFSKEVREEFSPEERASILQLMQEGRSLMDIGAELALDQTRMDKFAVFYWTPPVAFMGEFVVTASTPFVINVPKALIDQFKSNRQSDLAAHAAADYSVTKTQAATVTLQSTLPLDAEQAANINQQRTRIGQTPPPKWTLFYRMPTDAHRWFAHEAFEGLTKDDLRNDWFPQYGAAAWNALPADVSYKDILTRLLFPQAATGLDAEPYERLIDSYRFDRIPLKDRKAAIENEDGRLLNYADVDATNMDTWPDDTWAKVRFIRELTRDDPVDVGDVDSELYADRLDIPPFDPSGRASLPELRQGEVVNATSVPKTYDRTKKGYVEFNIDDEAVFDRDTTRLLTDGDPKYAQIVEPIYVRPLHDYRFNFRDIYNRVLELNDKIAGTEEAIKVTTRAKEKVEAQEAVRTVEKGKLEEDQGYFESEVKYAGERRELEQTVAKLQADINKLHGDIVSLQKGIAAIENKVIAEVEQRQREAAAKTP